MKISKLIVSFLLLLTVSLACKLLNRSSSGGLTDDKVSTIASSLPTYDPKAPPPSPGAVALRRLAELEPSAATLEREVETVERAALNKLLADLHVQVGTGFGPEQASSTAQFDDTRTLPVVATSSYPSAPALFLLQSKAEPGADSAHDAALIGGMISGLSDIFGKMLSEKGSVNKTETETKDGLTSTMSVELGRGEDGSTTFGFGVKTEGTKNGIAVKSDVNGRIDGQRCPNAEGQVSFTIKVKLGAESGATAFGQELTAFVRAVVNDDAKIATTTLELVQGTRQVKDGRSVYVETGQTFKNDGSSETGSNYREIRVSGQAKASDGHLSDEGLTAAYNVGRGALKVAEYNWSNGGCTTIEANSPGTVAPNSNTAIPVKVRQRFDKSEVSCKLVATLKGGTSIDPTTLPRTAGTLTYTAPGEQGKSATITLTATSRRGRATLELNADTGGQQYTVSGTSGPVTFSGQICSLDKPFVINGTFANGSETQTFTPSSSTSGTVQEAGNSGGCTQSGGGTYKIILNEQGSGTLEFTETVTGVCGSFSNTKTATFKVSLTPGSGLSCP